jgi:Restriction endonuclease NotI
MPKRTTSLKYPLAEVFGYPPENQSATAQNVRAHRWCPFNNPSGADCTKDKRDDPLGVCSIVQRDAPVITCPVRFREDYKILDDAAAFFFPNAAPERPPRMLSEVSLPDKNGKSAGNIDIVLAMLDENGYISEYGAVEIQAVYISGNVRGVFRDYMNHQADYQNHWRPDDYPRPDYLSSSRKRLAPQLLFKGSILNQWQRKMAVAVQRSFFHTLPTLQPVAPAQAQVAWLIYDLEPDPTDNRYHLVRTDTVYTDFQSALETITTPEVGDEQNFISKLQARVAPKKAAPDTTKLSGLLTVDDESV